MLTAEAGFARVAGLPDFTELVEKTGPAVVNIQITQFGERAQQNQDGMQNPHGEDIPEFFRRFFDVPGAPQGSIPDRRGAGSGFILESNGYIITNHHVVEDADQIIVRMADRREFEAELIGSDPLSDIALLKIDAKNLPTLKLGDSKVLKRGEWVVAIGSPFNFDQSVTAGIVSAKGRSNNRQQYVPFIQTDVAINQGNSGGPLLNMEGEVVGINSWILSSGGGYMGLSFSIPIETANRAVKQLREHGKVSRGLMGVQVGTVTREMAEAFGLERPVGALVNDVTAGSAAERAGIEPGDVILEFDGELIESSGDLPPVVGANPPGTEAEVLVSRNGKKKTFVVVLDALEADEDGNLLGSSGTNGHSNALGLLVESIDENGRRALGNPEGGVVVSRIESDAAFRAGLRVGDVILTINNMPVEDTGSFDEIVEDLPEDKAVALRVMRDGVTRYIAFSPAVEE
ncbi:MAG: DegQ family serine endoprotease [Xanthomonadales bacterium]|nr:DegQ family serine endoprotease [Gammaproteobacteria bacterium]MBT8053266.1 DegQ family serine endoprotease [Gammaproteobacteria bacterium]NND56039.1 DegQ family serine endoprotease [Xanthomonadales bacterium]NNK50306.1 DegQ family serine endoprotease [Xanthomonadales bacterium]